MWSQRVGHDQATNTFTFKDISINIDTSKARASTCKFERTALGL